MPQNSDRTALCVEDEPLIAVEIAEALRDMGFGTVLVANGLQSAQVLAKKHQIDVAFLDVNLGDGTSSAAFGRSLVRRGAHVVFASGYAKAELGAALLGFDFLEKPISHDDIERYFRALLDRPGGGRIAAE